MRMDYMKAVYAQYLYFLYLVVNIAFKVLLAGSIVLLTLYACNKAEWKQGHVSLCAPLSSCVSYIGFIVVRRV